MVRMPRDALIDTSEALGRGVADASRSSARAMVEIACRVLIWDGENRKRVTDDDRLQARGNVAFLDYFL